MSIAVDPKYQGQGIGKKLVKAFLTQAKKRDLEYINLTTDALNNDAVNHLYVSTGFKLYRGYTTPEGRKMNEYLFQRSRLEPDRNA